MGIRRRSSLIGVGLLLLGDDGPDVADEESHGPEGTTDVAGEGCGDWALSCSCLLSVDTVLSPVVPIGLKGVCVSILLMVLSSGIIGLEDGAVKASPVPSDPEKPGTPGEGVLSSDLDRIPTEGEACVGSSGYEGPPWEKKAPPVAWICTALVGAACLHSLAMSCGSVVMCDPLLYSSAACIPCHSPTELPKMESKDLQQLFKDVLGSEREQHLGCGTPGLEGSRTPLQRPFLQGTSGRRWAASLPAVASLVTERLSGFFPSDPDALAGGLALGSLPSSSPMDSYPGLCQSPFLDSRLVSMLNCLWCSLLSFPSTWLPALPPFDFEP